jgi:hypothetical protein
MSGEIITATVKFRITSPSGILIFRDDYNEFTGLFDPLPSKTIIISIIRGNEFPDVFIYEPYGQVLLKPTEIQNGILIYVFAPVGTDTYRVYIPTDLTTATVVVSRKKNVPINSSNL